MSAARAPVRTVQNKDQSWEFDGHDWTRTDDGWDFVDPVDEEETRRYNEAAMGYFTGHTISKCEEPSASALPSVPYNPQAHLGRQSDTGANVCATCYLQLLVNVVWITPSTVNTAKDTAPMTARAMGQLPVASDGQVRYVNCYYIPEVAGTILSPTAMVRQFSSEFIGFKKECTNFDTNIGVLTLIARDGYDDWAMPLKCVNDLWFHVENGESDILGDTIPHQHHISRLSDAAKFELWHQRLGHLGQYVTKNIHKHSIGVPPLRGNSFYKCPSCMESKCTKRCTHPHNPLGGSTKAHDAPMPDQAAELPKEEPPDPAPPDHEDEDLESFLDELHLPDALPGQHFHIDLGFVRGSDFKNKVDGKTVTSIDGKRCYCLIVDRATRYMWVYTSASKDPPIEAVKAVLEKFKSDNPHRTVRTDQDKSLGKCSDFKAMVEKAGFELELTGSDNSKQNSPAERPHRDLGQMMRCLLHSSNLGSKYWSYALHHAVFIKNRVPHSALGKSPFEAFTGKKPNLSHLRVFGSYVYAKDPGERAAKLDNHVSKGIYLGHSATHANVYYRDETTGNVKIGTHVFFDEAHMSVPSRRAPLAAEALQRLGYHVRESWIDLQTRAEYNADVRQTLLIEKLSATAIIPTRSTDESIGFDLHADTNEITIPPGSIQLIPTGIAAKCPSGTYLRIAPRSGLTVKRNIHTLAGVVDPDFTGNITVVLQNFGDVPQTFHRGDRIAQLIVEHALTPQVKVVDTLPTTGRGDDGFGSTEAKVSVTTPTSPPTDNPSATSSSSTSPPPLESVIRGLQLEFELPYDVQLSNDIFDNRTTRTIQVTGNHPTLGLDMAICPKHGMPQLRNCLKATPAGKILRWKSELKKSYITAIGTTPVSTIADIEQCVTRLRADNSSEVTIQFATLEKQAMHPEKGIPQVYSDQLNIIGEHLWAMKNDPAWQDRASSSIPVLEEMLQRDDFDPTDIDDASVRKTLHALKKRTIKQQRKLTRPFLMKQDNWDKWKESEWKQLDQYFDQDTFGEPQPPPKGENLLTLLWTYLIKDDGRLKARCVCNGSKKMRGSVTLAETYASSLEQTASRVFWAATATYNLVTIGADAANAFAEAPPPVAPLYVYCDQPFREWYKARTGKDIPKGYVMKVRKALQGHPELARLWAKLIDKVIRQLNLKPCTHEPNLYYSNDYNGTGKKVLFLRQVDDFAIGCEDVATADAIIEAINDKMTIEVKKLGLITRFNGVDITQTRDYVKLSNATYVHKILANHPWLTPTDYPTCAFPLPMRSDHTYQHDIENATPLSDHERDRYEQSMGFTYRQAIGELLFALVTCRPDISYPVVKLSQYSTKPAQIHFDAVKQIYAYLRDTADAGIYYWRDTPRKDMPVGPIPQCRRDENYDRTDVEELEQHISTILIGAKDSDFAGDTSHRRSVTGVVVKLAGGAVLWKTNFQKTVALSTTEAEFTAAAEAGKLILYLRTIMDEIGLAQEAATVLYEDNQGSLLMASAQKPTKRTRHVSVKTFALQDWVERDLLSMRRIDTIHNYSDPMTKALGRTLFYRHNDFIMGRVLPDYVRPRLEPTIQSLSLNDVVDFQSDRLLSKFMRNKRSREGVTPSFLIPIL